MSKTEAKLTLAPGLQLPLEAVTRTFAVLGIRGSGKTNTAVDLAEELLAAGQQVIVLDPVDVWWGLRSSADGKSAGFGVTILGGEHGDLPLEPNAGALIADFAVEHAASLVLSVRHLSMKEQRNFAADFAERLYFRKGKQEFRQPLHLIVDESDEFIPQRIPPGGERMFGAFDRIVRRGRSAGLGVTMISQRAQVVNKDVLSQIETLICHRVLHKLDREALQAWIVAHDTHGRQHDFMGSLASLGRGEAWIWSPEWLEVFKRVQIRQRTTFDSSATPKAGAKPPIKPRQMAAVDLENLRTKMSAVLEQGKANDPRELKRKIAELEAQIKRSPAKSAPADPAELERAYQRGVGEAEKRFLPELEQLRKLIRNTASQLNAVLGKEASAPVIVGTLGSPSPPSRPPHPTPPPQPSAPKNGGGSGLRGGERKILSVLAQYPDGRNDSQIAILTGYAVGSGNFNNLLSSLRSQGFAEGARSGLQITQAGLHALGPYDPLPTGAQLLAYWYGKLGRAERLILDQLASSYPTPLSDTEVAERAGYVAGTGNFNNALSRLRTLELIVGSRKDLRASENLF